VTGVPSHTGADTTHETTHLKFHRAGQEPEVLLRIKDTAADRADCQSHPSPPPRPCRAEPSTFYPLPALRLRHRQLANGTICPLGPIQKTARTCDSRSAMDAAFKHATRGPKQPAAAPSMMRAGGGGALVAVDSAK
jgi:hypothetical protein